MSLAYREEGGHRRVFQPLKKIGKCVACQQTGEKQYLCTKCGESVYCSAECQAKHWPEHKVKCGVTDRIGLESLYAFLAWLGCLGHTTGVPPHFALLHRITNDPNPVKFPIKCEEGWTAKLVVVDDRDVPMSWARPSANDLLQWFPKAESRSAAEKLYKRIMYGGHVLPILTAVAFTILSEIYTTTSGADRKYRRVRLKYKSSPIADFGIAKGAVAVQDEHYLAFYRQSDGSITRGQDPKDHYWLWFRSARGQEVILDLSMFTFDMCVMVATEGYIPPNMAYAYPVVPAFFMDRDIRKQAREAPVKAELHNSKECTRISVLHNKALEEVVTRSHEPDRVHDDDVQLMGKFMARVAGRDIADEEQKLAYNLANRFGRLLEDHLKSRLWVNSPPTPRIAFALDPGESDGFDERVRRFWDPSQNQRDGSNAMPTGDRGTAQLEQLVANLFGSLSVGDPQI